METRTERRDAMRGGSGHVFLKHILGEKELAGKCRLFAQVTLEPGCSIGYHEHNGESETYYILSGEGIFNDNGAERPIGAGEAAYTKDAGHAIANSGSTDLVFMALIIPD